jgi:uncharacterized protein with FMN-binding domain
MRKKYIIIIIAIIVITATSITIKLTISNSDKRLEQLKDLTISNVDLSKIESGVYYGSYESFPVSAEVKVIINDHKITIIELVKHNNGQGKAAEILPDKVTKAQSLDVDIVSGATYSSKVILKAIENALNKQ